jgi:hypothetical protein
MNTTTATIDGITRTTWTVANHTLTAYQRTGGRIDWEIHTDGHGVPNLALTGGWGKPYAITVSWPSIGATAPEEAQEFAAQISVAAGAAANFEKTIKLFH